MADQSEPIQQQVCEALAAKTPLRIVGGGSKPWYGRPVSGKPLSLASHSGIVNYQPSELVLTARAGTRLAEIEQLLAAHGQMLAFEPPHFTEAATIGGAMACGLSGPRRPFAGAARDVALGCRIINGKGELLRFGGEVVKNVAGFDVTRLMVGAMGTLGVLLEVSLKVLPRPAAECTLTFEMSAAAAIRRMNEIAGKPLPVSAAAWHEGRMYLRLSGSAAGVKAAVAKLGGEEDARGRDFWHDLREQRHAFFAGDAPLWRLSLPPATPHLEIDGEQLIDWGGAQRWLRSDMPAAEIREQATAAVGHATLFRHGGRTGDIFTPLSPPLLRLHRRLKAAFDPQRILNPGRMYEGL